MNGDGIPGFCVQEALSPSAQDVVAHAPHERIALPVSLVIQMHAVGTHLCEDGQVKTLACYNDQLTLDVRAMIGT
ncbi:hypothetical protein, partial [Deinococcus sp.]|uniref:hypothetical protein n=1 Tax=Deinococcus sp. TaxID=47478 RepID=UPI002869D26B